MTYPTSRSRPQAEKLTARSRRRRFLTVGVAGLATVAGATIAGIAPAAANDGGVATTDYSAQQGYAWSSDSSTSSGSSYSSGSSAASSSSSHGSARGTAASSASYNSTASTSADSTRAASTSADSTRAASTTRAAAPQATASVATEVKRASYTSSSASGGKTGAAQWAAARASNPGVYYSYGGGGANGYDCSSFTQAAMAQAGKSIPRTSGAQYAGGQKVSVGNMQAGDLVFWSNDGSGSGVYHVAMYIGDGKIAHARNSSMGVSVTDLHYSPNNMLGTAVRY